MANNRLIPAPSLAKEAQLPNNLELDGCPWLDQYVEFSQLWSPKSFDGYHEAIGLWLLSTIAARRVVVLFGGRRYTNLYILLVGRTSLYAKTTAVKIGKDFLIELDLDYLLLPDECTPQQVVQEMSTTPPGIYRNLSANPKMQTQDSMSFAGQRGWYYDEFGTNIQNMMKSSGPYSEFRGLLKKFDDTEETYTRGTIIRGIEVIQRPYLALLGILTPADIAPFAKRGHMLWGDGYFARMALVVAPEIIKKDCKFPIGERIFNQNLKDPIVKWHRRLGFHAQNSKLELSTETQSAYYKYQTALTDILENMNQMDFDGNYARFPEKALRIAALFASLGVSKEININHWAKAQAIVERWRSNLHSLYKQVNSLDLPAKKLTGEQTVLMAIQAKVYPTSREIRQYTGLSPDEITEILKTLEQANKVISEKSGKTIRHKLNDKPEQIPE